MNLGVVNFYMLPVSHPCESTCSSERPAIHGMDDSPKPARCALRPTAGWTDEADPGDRRMCCDLRTNTGSPIIDSG